ncbi:MAG: hypothetical protein OXR73_17815 [Myxococcales bacterium]|nr:hypothetical protein [Myxococcales bacterium]
MREPRFRSRTLWLVLALLPPASLGCGGAMPEGPSRGSPVEVHRESAAGDDVERYVVQIDELGLALHAALGEAPSEEELREVAPPPPPARSGDAARPALAADPEASPLSESPDADCLEAADIVGRICELAERICAIAARHPQDTRVQAQCDDGRRACEGGRRRFGAACPPD